MYEILKVEKEFGLCQSHSLSKNCMKPRRANQHHVRLSRRRGWWYITVWLLLVWYLNGDYFSNTSYIYAIHTNRHDNACRLVRRVWKVFHLPGFENLDFHLLNWLTTKAEEPILPFYLAHIWAGSGNKIRTRFAVFLFKLLTIALLTHLSIHICMVCVLYFKYAERIRIRIFGIDRY